MTLKTTIAVFAAGAIALAAAGTAATRVSAQPGVAAVVDLSAKEDKNKNKNKGPQQPKKKSGLQNKGAQGPSQKRLGGSKSSGQKQKSSNQGSRQQKQFGGSKSGGQKQKSGNKGSQQQKQFGGSKSGRQKQKFGGPGGLPPQQPGGSKGAYQKGGPGKYGSHKHVKIYKPRGGKNYNSVTARRLHGLPPGASRAYVHGRHYSAWRGHHGYRIRYHDRWRTFVPLSALAVLLVGQRPFFPYAYIAAPEYYCYGRTEDGCLLNWEEIETIEGDLIGQCVAYCPWEEY